MAKKARQTISFDASMRIVVLHGREGYLVPEYTRQLEGALRETHGDIETFTFDGRMVSLAEVLDELRSYGLMQSHKLVILDAADEFLASKKDGEEAAGKVKNRSALENYAQNPVDHATLLLRADTWRKGNLDKHIEKVGRVFKVEPPDEREAVNWCRGRCAKRYGATIDAEAAMLLVQRIGVFLARLDGELQKLANYVGEGGAISREDVVAMVGLSREEEAWAIQNAVLSGSASASLGLLRELFAVPNKNEIPVTWAMCDLMRKTYAAGALASQGVSPHEIKTQLKLFWGSDRPVMNMARSMGSRESAHLLRRGIETDMKTKRGLGKPARSIEALAVLIADRMSSPRN